MFIRLATERESFLAYKPDRLGLKFLLMPPHTFYVVSSYYNKEQTLQLHLDCRNITAFTYFQNWDTVCFSFCCWWCHAISMDTYIGLDQCDQIRRLIIVPRDKFSIKSWWLLGLFWKTSLWGINCCRYSLLDSFWKIGLLFIFTMVRTLIFE